MKRIGSLLLAVMMIISGCASWNSESGVSNTWRDAGAVTWQVGQTTENDVAQAFGPPSQVIALQDQTVFYYLREQKRGKGLFLLLWNWGENNTVYDRAIFFFDETGILTKYAYSREALPYVAD